VGYHVQRRLGREAVGRGAVGRGASWGGRSCGGPWVTIDFLPGAMFGSLARMPASGAQDVRRGRLLQGIFWGGIGLAPLAILVLLFGHGSGSLRVAVILAVLTVVMIAVSVVLRPSVELVRVDIEERVLDEVDRVRVQAREDITTAARNTHRALSEKIRALTQTIEALRALIEEVQTGTTPPASPVAPVASASARVVPNGVIRRTETVHVTRRTTTVDAADERGTVYGSRAAADGEWSDRETSPARATGDMPARPSRPVARHSDDADGRAYRRDEPSDGDGWAAAPPDDHGVELRLGERRSSVRRDERGYEVHIEDRWAALRDDELRSGRAADGLRSGRDADRLRSGRPADEYSEADWESTFRSLRRQSSTPALPTARGQSPDRYTEVAEDRDAEWARPAGHRHERHSSRDRDHPYESDPGSGRDPGSGHDRDSGRDRDWERGRGARKAPRPRTAHPSEYDRGAWS
jgi:hypothetical protein